MYWCCVGMGSILPRSEKPPIRPCHDAVPLAVSQNNKPSQIYKRLKLGSAARAGLRVAAAGRGIQQPSATLRTSRHSRHHDGRASLLADEAERKGA